MLMPGAAKGDGARMSEPGAPVRIPFVHGCRLTTAARVRGGLVCNLSTLGTYVTLDEPLPETGETVQVTIALPGQEPVVQAEAIVASQNRQAPLGPDSLPPGIGLRFLSLGPVYRARVETLIRQYHDGRGHLVLASPPHAGPRRVPFVQHCRLSTAHGVRETLICNLSRLGVYVAVDPRPAVGDEIGLSFVTPDKAQIDVKGIVSWHSPDTDSADGAPLPPEGGLPVGCGVRFVALSRLDELRIRALVDNFPRFRNG
jgi:hypothetical protein